MTQVENRLTGITWVDPNTLQMDHKNRNIHPPEQIEQLIKIIRYQGWRHPIVVSNQDQLIKAGHGRVMAAIQMGLKEVPVSYQDFDDDTMAYTFLISDNAIASQASLDLSGINTDIGDFGPFDIELLGMKDFSVTAVEKLEPGCDEDEVPEHVEPKTKMGDCYSLGAHRLLCGDSTSVDAVEKLMNGEKADMVFTDPPYGMFLETNYDQMFSTDSSHRNTGERFSKVKGDHEDFSPELINTIFAAFPNTDEIFLWGADYYSELIPDRKKGSWIVWDKRCNENMDKVTGNTFELCWSKQKHKRLIARLIWSGHHGMQTDDTKTRVHPTQKPSKLIEWFFERWGNPKDKVVDLFGGSGSTLIACEKTNRKCFMLELDPHYVDVIIARWEKYTGKKAILLNV